MKKVAFPLSDFIPVAEGGAVRTMIRGAFWQLGFTVLILVFVLQRKNSLAFERKLVI